MAEARRYRDQREKTYRAQALKLYPWICARCGQEFSGTKLRELTVHHKDLSPGHNPPEGSNWELLCLSVTTMSTRGIRLLTRMLRLKAGRGARATLYLQAVRRSCGLVAAQT